MVIDIGILLQTRIKDGTMGSYLVGKVVRSMKQYEVLIAKELFHGSDVVRGFAYKAGTAGDNYALFQKTDCFVCNSPFDGRIGSMTDL